MLTRHDRHVLRVVVPPLLALGLVAFVTRPVLTDADVTRPPMPSPGTGQVER